MANADNLRSLGEDIANAYDNRIGFIKELRSDVSGLLKGFASKDRERARGNKEIRAEVSKLLTEFKQEGRERAKEVADMLSNEHEKRTAQVSDMLKDIHNEHKERRAQVSETSAVFKEIVAKMAAKRGIKSHPRRVISQ